ncbi:ABC transporter ATP-binding protein [Sporichthya sp.]|uniref:ABC transporter ATP-binding protein n=1 Tax=Sporichthya sp. TaxID=65475 RepID=UPI00180CAF5D|nr:ABC transporter ATP-binding protein [Sporichthya sp.]MBA3741600.1 ABC transporter ATP-binding protein [Sporichthya sp.]
MSGPAIEISGLRKSYGGRAAVDGLDLTVPRGGVTAVLGPNGAGKTTTLEICSGLRVADAGSVQVLGLDPRRDHAALRPRIGVMLQAGGVYSGAKPEEMLRHVAALHANPLDPAALLDLLGLQDARRTTYRRMSGGEKQLLALGLAVIGRPELAFLDEPTAGLDPHARRRTWDLISSLREHGVTVVLTTHLLDEAEALADQVHIVDHGRVIAGGTPAELTRVGVSNSLTFRAPGGLPVAALTGALPEGTVATEPSPGVYVVSGPMDPTTLAAVTSWCADLGVMPDGLLVERRSLEDVFLDLTGRGLEP